MIDTKEEFISKIIRNMYNELGRCEKRIGLSKFNALSMLIGELAREQLNITSMGVDMGGTIHDDAISNDYLTVTGVVTKYRIPHHASRVNQSLVDNGFITRTPFEYYNTHERLTKANSYELNPQYEGFLGSTRHFKVLDYSHHKDHQHKPDSQKNIDYNIRGQFLILSLVIYEGNKEDIPKIILDKNVGTIDLVDHMKQEMKKYHKKIEDNQELSRTLSMKGEKHTMNDLNQGNKKKGKKG